MAKTLVYQMYPIAWPTGLKGMTDHLKMVAELGVDFVWVSPLYPSPRYDHGYDISNYTSIDPRFGTMADFDAFVKEAHRYGMGVMMDLVLNHTSTQHPWFRSKPNYYCWSKTDRKGWKNLFDGASAWKYDAEMDQYYLHLFHEEQADLRWFIDGELNQELVREFRDIVHFWLKEHKVNGFRLDVPQSLNKDLSADDLDFEDLIKIGEDSSHDQAVQVLNAVFGRAHGEDYLLIAEGFDASFGDLADYYYANTTIDYVLNVLLKEQIDISNEVFNIAFEMATSNNNVIVDLESHDSPRFTSRSGRSAKDILTMLFHSRADAICLYQGQELGLENPSKEELPDEAMIALDAQTAMRVARGASPDSERANSRANARVPLPTDQYQIQKNDSHSVLNLVFDLVTEWKQH